MKLNNRLPSFNFWKYSFKRLFHLLHFHTVFIFTQTIFFSTNSFLHFIKIFYKIHGGDFETFSFTEQFHGRCFVFINNLQTGIFEDMAINTFNFGVILYQNLIKIVLTEFKKIIFFLICGKFSQMFSYWKIGKHSEIWPRFTEVSKCNILNSPPVCVVKRCTHDTDSEDLDTDSSGKRNPLHWYFWPNTSLSLYYDKWQDIADLVYSSPFEIMH